MDGWWSEIDRDVRSCLERFGPMSRAILPANSGCPRSGVLRAVDAGAGRQAPDRARGAAAGRR